jgi:hypothetical protein
VIGLIVVSTLLFVRLWLYWGTALGNFTWLANTLGAVFDFYRGLRPELLLILTSAFLWQRGVNATSRDMGFFGVGLSFRLGLLLLILGAGLLSGIRGQDTTPLLWLYLALGLTGVAIARTQDKAASARSSGSLPSVFRLGQLFLAVGITVGATAWLSFYFTPDSIKRTLFVWLRPLWILLRPLLGLLLQALLWLLQPLFMWLDWLLRRLSENLDWTFLQELTGSFQDTVPPEQMAEPSGGLFAGLPPWVWAGLRYILVLLVAALALGLVLLFLDRMQARPDRDEGEEETGEELTLGGAALERGVRWLRDVAGLVRRFGLSRQLLAAISVQNMYANLCRLARQRGYPRRPAQPPDDYLPVLEQVFAGQGEELTRITAAYMRVHYGDQIIGSAELAQLRQDYNRVRHTAQTRMELSGW